VLSLSLLPSLYSPPRPAFPLSSPPSTPSTNKQQLSRDSTGCLPSSFFCKQVVASLNELASAFGTLKSAHSKAQSAIKAYAAAIDDSEEPTALLAQFPALFSLDGAAIKAVRCASSLPSSHRRRRSRTSDTDFDFPFLLSFHLLVQGSPEADVPAKRKRGPNKEKKVKDPNAPKRPASAYIEYQNSVRDEFRKQYSELPYSEVLKKIGLVWQGMSDADKKVRFPFLISFSPLFDVDVLASTALERYHRRQEVRLRRQEEGVRRRARQRSRCHPRRCRRR
jgi:hypothetical protein